MKKLNIVSAITISLMLATGVVGIGPVFQPSQAVAQSVSPEVGRPLQSARELAEQKKFNEAIAEAKKADAVSKKSDYEAYMVNEILGSIYLQARQYSNAASTLEKSLSLGQLSAEDTVARTKLLAQIFYQEKNYGKAVEYGQSYINEAGEDQDILVIISQSQYLSKQYTAAVGTTQRLIRSGQRSGGVNESWFQLLMSSQFELGNEDGVKDALELLIRYHPQPRYWRDYLQLVEKGLRGGTTKTALDVLRFRLSVGAMRDAKDYTDMAELALQEGLPGDAKRALEKGKAEGVIGSGPQAGRHDRLMTMATERAAEDSASLSAGESEAAAMATGDADVRFGEAYWTYGQYDAAIAAIQRGIDKGVENMNDAQLRLGLAYLGAGDKANATAAFKKIAADTPESIIASLWTLKGSI